MFWESSASNSELMASAEPAELMLPQSAEAKNDESLQLLVFIVPLRFREE